MKTKKLKNDNKASKLPPKVQRAAKVFQDYLASRPKEPVKVVTEQEKAQSEYIRLNDTFYRDLKFIQDQLWILSELAFAPHDCDIPLQNLYGTITEIDMRLNKVEETAKQFFNIFDPRKEKAA